MSPHPNASLAAAGDLPGIRESARAAYRALHHKYVGPPAADAVRFFVNPEWESLHDLQAVRP